MFSLFCDAGEEGVDRDAIMGRNKLLGRARSWDEFCTEKMSDGEGGTMKQCVE